MKLEDIIPSAAARKPIYQIFGLIGLILGAVQVAFTAIPDSSQPVWLGVALTVYAFLAAAGFTVSQANTVTPTATITDIPEVPYVPAEALPEPTEFEETATPKHVA